VAIKNDDISCDDANGLGNITVYVDENGNGSVDAGEQDLAKYTFTWVDNTPNPISATAGMEYNITALSHVDADFVVTVLNTQTGCTASLPVTIADAAFIPDITLTPTNSTVCDPALTLPLVSFNGAITVTLTDPNSVFPPYNDYQFDLYNGKLIDPLGPSIATIAEPAIFAGPLTPDPAFIDLDSGFYRVIATNLVTGCVSLAQEVEIKLIPIAPPITITLNQGMTSCAGPNANITADAGAGSFTYDWFLGGNTNTPFDELTMQGRLLGGLGETLDSIDVLTYTVLVTDLGTGCTATKSISITDDSEDPGINTVVVTVVDNSICDTNFNTAIENGSITFASILDETAGVVPVPDGTGTYRIVWYSGNLPVAGQMIDTTDAALIDLAKGDYTAVVINTNTQCTSNPETFTINDVFDNPDTEMAITDQTSCDPAMLNGEIFAFDDDNLNGAFDAVPAEDIGGNANFEIRWFEGSDTTDFIDPVAPMVGALVVMLSVNEDTLSGLPTGFYTVAIRDLTTGCVTQKTVNLPEVIVNPEFTYTVTDITDCSFDGSIAPDFPEVTAGPAPQGYMFEWYEGGIVVGVPFAVTYDAVAIGLGFGTGLPVNGNLETLNDDVILSSGGQNVYAGDWTVVATDIDANCTTDPVTETINRPAPLFNIGFNVNFKPSLFPTRKERVEVHPSVPALKSLAYPLEFITAIGTVTPRSGVDPV